MYPFVPASQTIIHAGLFIMWLYLMCVPAWLTSWMTSEFNSYANLEVSSMFRKVPTIILFLVDVQTYLHYLYAYQAEPYLYGNNIFF